MPKALVRHYYGTAGAGRSLYEEAKPSTVVLDVSGVVDLEYTVLKTLTDAERRLRAQGVTLWRVELNPSHIGHGNEPTLGRGRLHANVLKSRAGCSTLPSMTSNLPIAEYE